MYSEICDEEEEDPRYDKTLNKCRAAESFVLARSKSTLPWRSKKHAELDDEIANMSEEKSRKLFPTERERESWIDEIRTSVEQNIQSQVRAVLGTPPIEKRKKLYEERLASERRKWQLDKDKANSGGNPERKIYSCAYIEEEDEIMMFRRQHCLQKFNNRQTMKAALLQQPDFTTRASINGSSVCLDPLSDEFSKNFSPYTRAALDNLRKTRRADVHVFKRAVGSLWFDRNGTRYELPGLYWPKDHLPVYPNQNHIHYIPRDVEPLNTPVANQCTGVHQNSPVVLYPRQWCGHQVVYDRQLKEQAVHKCAPTTAPGLVFESRFECGNLRQAKRIGNYDYDLVLNTDLYTKRHTQWYYFCVQGMVAGVTYTFNIINLLKKDSLYNYGMKPLLYSETDASQEGLGWIRAGHHIDYHKNTSYRHNPLLCNLDYHTLTFQMEFPHDTDTCYLAHCYPYSYTDLELYLRTMVDQPHTSQYVRKEVLCRTVAGNSCYVLTITSSKVPDSEKLGVVLSARVHPGETNASWMMKGMMDFLTSGHPVAQKLRRKFVFKVVPMLNPDGVIVGNYRTNLAARDLNRTYREPNKENFPTVWHTKNMLEMFRNDHEVIIYCDLHGHSRKPNVFMYGCTADTKMNSMNSFVEERLFPWMMSQKAPDKFSFSGCKFQVRKCKESTARVVMWRQMGISNSFTMEATFCGANFGEIEKGRHFNVGDFEAMGRHFCEVLLDYSEAKSGNRSELTQAFVELACKMTRDILKQTLGSFRPEKADNNQAGATMTTGEATGREHEETGASGENVGEGTSPWGDRSCNMQDLSSQNDPASIKNVRMESFNDCIKILEGLNLVDHYGESDSSDSDSDMENDDSDAEKSKGDTESKEAKDKRKKKKKKKKPKQWWDALSKPVASQEPSKGDEGAKHEQKKVKTNVKKFINPYNNRSNGGIPIFSQERITERSRRKELQKNEEKKDCLVKFSDDTDVESAPLFAFNGDADLNYITAQRRLAHYMLSRNASRTVMPTPPYHYQHVVKQLVEVDTFKFDYLSAADHGFSIRVPGQQPTQRSLWVEEKNTDNRFREQRGLQSFEEARREHVQRRRKISPAYAVDLEDNTFREMSYQPSELRTHDKGRDHEIFSRHINNLRRSQGQSTVSHGDEKGSSLDSDSVQLTRGAHSSTLSDHKFVSRDWNSYDSTEDTKKSHSAGASTTIHNGPEFVPSVLPSHYSHT